MTASLAEARSHAITSDQLQAHDAAIREAKRDRDEAAAAFARAKKAAKNAAVDLKAYKLLEQIRRLDDDEQIVVARHFVQYLNWLEMPIGTQLSLLDAPRVAAPSPAGRDQEALTRAGEAGLKAGRLGEPADSNPFEPWSEESEIWAAKHQHGLAEIATAEDMAQGVEPPPTTKRTRGRNAAASVKAAMERSQRHLNGEPPVH